MLRKVLASLLVTLPIAAHADWREATTPHFIVYSQQRTETLRTFATRLEQFDQGLRRMRGVADQPVAPVNRVTVYVVGDVGDVEKLARSEHVAGFYRPRAGGSLAIVPRTAGTGETDLSAMAILLHEYVHHFMLSLFPHAAYPAWFVEGYAELHATARFEKDGTLTFGAPPQYRASGLMHGNGLPLQKLLVAETLKLDDAQRDSLYGRGWLLTHYLSFSGKRNGQLSAYLAAINQGKSSAEAGAAAFGDLKVLDRELERYKLGSISLHRLTAPVTAGEVTIRELTAGEDATMEVRIRSKNGVNAKTAPDVYAAARKAAAPYPNDRSAQLVLAEAAYDAGDYAASDAAADRAIAADERAVDGYVYKAMCHMALAERAGDKSKETWTAIRKIINQGNRIDTEDPEPLMLFYRTYGAQGVAPTENANLGLYRAFELAPQDVGLRFNTAAMFLRVGNKTVARALLAPLAFSPHNRGLARTASMLVALIDKGDLDGARKALDTDASAQE